MKKFLVMLMFCITMFLASCTHTDGDTTPSTDSFLYSVKVEAAGDGNLVLAYPTGDFTLKGNAMAKATSSNDSISFKVPNNCINYLAVVNNPSDYSADEVKLANNIESVIHMDTLEGNWKVDIVGYARYGQIYLVIDEHWPKDTVATLE